MAGNKEFQKRANLALVMGLLRSEGALSRIDLSRRLGLDKSTITNITSRLLKSRLIEEQEGGEASPRAGRRPVLIAVRPSAGAVLGCEIRAGVLRGLLTDLRGEITASIEKDFVVDPDLPGPGLVKGVEKLLGWAKAQLPSPSALLGFGLALPAQVNPKTGVLLNSRALRLKDYPLQSELRRLFALPCVLENDANSAARGEILAAGRVGETISNLIFLLPEFYSPETRSGTAAGLGLGLVVDGTLCYGNAFMAGELRGHRWQPNSANSLGLPERVIEQAPRDPEALEELVQTLAIDLKVVLSVLNPSHLFIGGKLRDDLPLIAGRLQSQFPQSGCVCLPSTFGSWEVAFGAAAGLLDELYRVPPVDSSGFSELDWEEILARKEAE